MAHADAEIVETEPVACCPSCGARAHGAYCARCGESIVAHAPTAGEFLHEFIGHYVALEGKLWRTLRTLLFKPGQLTSEYVRGRRISSINPLRLYLTLSLVVFALIKLVGVDLPQLMLDKASIGLSYVHTIPQFGDSDKPARIRISLEADESDDVAGSTVAGAIALLGSVDATRAQKVQQFMATAPADRADLLNRGFLAYLPYMLIGALPLFALYLKLLYWRSHFNYGQHLVFALHVTAFAFLLVIVMICIPGNLAWLIGSVYHRHYSFISVWDCVQLLPLAWMAAYLPAALHHVYGGRKWTAWAKSFVLASVHLLVILGLIVSAGIIAVLGNG